MRAIKVVWLKVCALTLVAALSIIVMAGVAAAPPPPPPPRSGAIPVLASIKLPAAGALQRVPVRITIRAPRVGDVDQFAESQRGDLTFRVYRYGALAGTVKSKNRSREVYRRTVLGTQGKILTKVRLQNLEHRVVETAAGGAEKLKLKADHGKIYLMDYKHGSVAITDGQGRPVTPAEAKALRDVAHDLGKAPQASVFVPARAIKPGEVFDLRGADAARLFFVPLAEIKKVRLTLTYRGVRKRGARSVAVFAFVFAADGRRSAKGLRINLRLKGDIELLVKGGDIYAFTGQGLFAADSTTRGGAMKGDGSLTGRGLHTIITRR